MASVITVYVLIIAVASWIAIYASIQLKRIDAIGSIRMHWIWTDDDRLGKYSFDSMLLPNKHNLLGIRYPKDEHFK